MDPSTTAPAFFRQLNPIEQQAYGSHGVHPALDGSVSQWQAPYGQFMTDQNHVLHPLNLPQESLIHSPQNAGSFGDIGDTRTMPATPMGPAPKRRKKKAPTLRAKAWEPYKARILELHVTQKLSLEKVKKKIEEEFGFTAEYGILSKVERNSMKTVLICALQDTSVSNTHKPMGEGQEHQASGDGGNCQETTTKEAR
jgi:hypothetical protein